MYTGCAAVDRLSEDSVTLAEGGAAGFYSECDIEIFCRAAGDAAALPGEEIKLPAVRDGFLVTVECPRKTKLLSWRPAGQTGRRA